MQKSLIAGPLLHRNTIFTCSHSHCVRSTPHTF